MSDIHVSEFEAAKAFGLAELVDEGLVEELHDEAGEARYVATDAGLEEVERILGREKYAEVEAAYGGGMGRGDPVIGLLVARVEGSRAAP